MIRAIDHDVITSRSHHVRRSEDASGLVFVHDDVQNDDDAYSLRSMRHRTVHAQVVVFLS